jgi:hypothetical protein
VAIKQIDCFANIETGIHIDAPAKCRESDGLNVSGRYQIPYSNETVPDQPILMPKHIVLVVTRGANYAAMKPFKDIVVFEDDVHGTDEIAMGNFKLNVFDHIQFNGPGDYYILCSLGSYLSNITKVTVE